MLVYQLTTHGIQPTNTQCMTIITTAAFVYSIISRSLSVTRYISKKSTDRTIFNDSICKIRLTC